MDNASANMTLARGTNMTLARGARLGAVHVVYNARSKTARSRMLAARSPDSGAEELV